MTHGFHGSGIQTGEKWGCVFCAPGYLRLQLEDYTTGSRLFCTWLQITLASPTALIVFLLMEVGEWL